MSYIIFMEEIEKKDDYGNSTFAILDVRRRLWKVCFLAIN